MLALHIEARRLQAVGVKQQHAAVWAANPRLRRGTECRQQDAESGMPSGEKVFNFLSWAKRQRTNVLAQAGGDELARAARPRVSELRGDEHVHAGKFGEEQAVDAREQRGGLQMVNSGEARRRLRGESPHNIAAGMLLASSRPQSPAAPNDR